ncbi:MAG: 5'-methylthioadenosine/adenosylhomocysteine nucleosidase [Bacteroidales bacterium]|nr:5'-methylthioadenosine/adenosylhomocysteine nucleosidase [Bacteroidales bacterium]
MNNQKIAIIVAMESEEKLVKNLFADFSIEQLSCTTFLQGNIGNKTVALLRCGIGKVNAAMMTTELIAQFQPELIINSGVAGGLGKQVRVGDVVVATECTYHDMWCGSGEWGQVQGLPARFAAPANVLAVAEAMKDEHMHFGLICTGDQFICNVEMVDTIKKNFPTGLAVDMESTAIAQVCYVHQVPFLSFRVISDTPGMEHDNTAQYLDFWTTAPQTTFAVLQQLITRL